MNNSQIIMQKTYFKKAIIPVIILAVLAIAMSSCQRGYGCPYKMQARTEVKR
jgi:hypothetical protein